MMKKCRIITALVWVMLSPAAFAQSGADSLTIHYKEGYSEINLSVGDNQQQLNSFIERVRQVLQGDSNYVAKVDLFTAEGYCSPTSSTGFNEKLSKKRAVYLAQHLRQFMMIPDSVVRYNWHGIDWATLQRQVEEENMPHRYEVLDIIRNIPIIQMRKGQPYDYRKNQLRYLDGGKAWRYMTDHYFADMRRTDVRILYRLLPRRPEQGGTLLQDNGLPLWAKALDNEAIPASLYPKPYATQVDTLWRSPRQYFALKTNLLYDVASALNVELEVPIGKRWSVMGEYMFPWWIYGYKRNLWWLWNHGQNGIEIIIGSLEARYWLQSGTRQLYTPQKGWFIGVFGGTGYYDLERHAKGYQGEFYMAGVSAGWVKPLSRQWLFELSASAGCLQTRYRHYYAWWRDKDYRYHLYRLRKDQTSWMGPLKVKMSLVWYPIFYKRESPQKLHRRFMKNFHSRKGVEK